MTTEIHTPDFLKAATSTTTENRDPVVLRWNDCVIRSLKDMRENFIPEELLQAHLNNELYYWLIQHYYESEAADVKNIKLEDQNCLLKLCKILGITYSAPVDSEKARILDEKRDKISAITAFEYHSPLAIAFRNALTSRKRDPYYHLDFNYSNASKSYGSKYECEAARDKLISEVYQQAQKHFDPGTSTCLANEAAKFYDSEISRVFSPVLENLSTLCVLCHQKELFVKISELVRCARKRLRKKFEEELTENHDFYAMYDIDYFRDKTVIEKYDYRIANNDLIRFLEKIATDHIQYTITGWCCSLPELEDDLNKHSSTFFSAAYAEYQNYISDIVDLLEKLGNDFPKFDEGESLSDYISRMCIKKAL
jgi:hypothetical protein